MSSEIASVFERIEPLNGTNYRSWSFSLKMLLIARELWEVVDDKSERPGDEKKSDQARWDKKDKSVFATIALAMKPSEQEHIHSCKTAKEAWDHLREVYQGKGMYRLLSLMKELSRSKLPLGKEGAMKDYIRGIMQVADEIAEIREDYRLKDAIVMAFVLNGLPDQYRYLVVNLESQLETMTLQEVSARLVDEEIKIGTISLPPEGPTYSSSSFLARSVGGKISVCQQCGKNGHFSDKCWSKEMCTHCGRMGHIEERCFTRNFQESKGKGRSAFLADGNGRANPTGMVRTWETG